MAPEHKVPDDPPHPSAAQLSPFTPSNLIGESSIHHHLRQECLLFLTHPNLGFWTTPPHPPATQLSSFTPPNLVEELSTHHRLRHSTFHRSEPSYLSQTSALLNQHLQLHPLPRGFLPLPLHAQRRLFLHYQAHV